MKVYTEAKATSTITANEVVSYNSHSSSDTSEIRDRIVKEYDRKQQPSLKDKNSF